MDVVVIRALERVILPAGGMRNGHEVRRGEMVGVKRDVAGRLIFMGVAEAASDWKPTNAETKETAVSMLRILEEQRGGATPEAWLAVPRRRRLYLKIADVLGVELGKEIG
jgi:hypothetical protein